MNIKISLNQDGNKYVCYEKETNQKVKKFSMHELL